MNRIELRRINVPVQIGLPQIRDSHSSIPDDFYFTENGIGNITQTAIFKLENGFNLLLENRYPLKIEFNS